MSSEIAESRERFEKWLKGEPIEVKTLNRTNGHYVVFDIEKMWNSYQQAERDTRERVAKFIENAMIPESFRKTKIYTESEQEVDKYFKMLADSIRGKE